MAVLHHYQATPERDCVRQVVRWCILTTACWWLCSVSRGVEPTALFVPHEGGIDVWKKTVATIAGDWPVVLAEPPDYAIQPPRPGVIETAWVEPSLGASVQAALASTGSGHVPQRQRMVVSVTPVATGAWVNTVIQTESLIDGPSSQADGNAIYAWRSEPADAAADAITIQLASHAAAVDDRFQPLPPLDGPMPGKRLSDTPLANLPWADSRTPRLSRFWHQVARDYRNFYSCESMTCMVGAFGAGALMANTGFDTTMQNAWMRSVEPTTLGTFFSGCKPIGEGSYALPVYGAAYATGLVFEGGAAGDVVGEWGGRSLRMFAVGAPFMYAMQWVTGGSRPNETSAGSNWKPFQDDNGVSGHAFVGAIPFMAAADMVESPLAKGALYVCSTFVGFSRMTDDRHYPSQIFLGWYVALASSRSISSTEMQFGDVELRIVPLPMADQGGLAVEATW
ncbi:MAG: phosphatase PAP2 family protein [Planctomycetia bacterium]